MEPIIDYLRRELLAAGPKRWAPIAAEVSKSLPTQTLTYHSLRQIAYGQRPNLGLLAGQALLDYFKAVESGAVRLPEEQEA